MGAVMLGIAWGLLGLDSGWRPLPGGGMEYTIQIAPHELDVFKQDKTIEVDIPPHLGEIRTFRVVVGNDILRRQDPPKSPPTSAKPSSPPTWPDAPTTPSAQRKSSPYNPFASLTSEWSKYRSGRTDSDSGKRTADMGTAGLKKTLSDPRPDEKPKADRPASQETSKGVKETPQPWLPFTVVVLALFGSLGGNLYMGWITWETRARYHALLRRRKKGERRLRERSYEPDDDDERDEDEDA